MTFYEALNEFEDRYLAALAVESKRVIDILDQDWQTINNEFNMYNAALSEGKTTEAEGHIQNIIDILTDNNIIVTEPVALPLPPAITVAPSTVPIICDGLGNPISYVNATAYVTVYLGYFDDTSNWTITITGQTDATATNLVSQEQIDITSISAASGIIEVTCSKTNYQDFVVNITVYKVEQGDPSYVINASPSNIIIPVAGTPVYTNAISYMQALVANVDDTGNWTFAVDAVSNVTANIASGNEVHITNISADSGYVDVEASKAGFDSVILRIPAYKTGDLSDYYTKTESDNLFVHLTGAETVAGVKTFSSEPDFQSGVAISSGNLDMTLGNITITSGNATLTSGDLNLVSGDIDLTGGLSISGNITQSGTASTIDIDPYNSLRIGRTTNNASFSVDILRGDNTTTVNHKFEGVGDSYVCGNNGNFGVKDTTPSEALSVTGNIAATGNVSGVNLQASGNVSGVNLNASGDLTAGDDVTLAGDITQTGTATSLGIDPYQTLDIGEVTNNANFRVNIYSGDGTSTVNHLLEGDGDSYLCRQGDGLSIGHTTAPRGAIDVYDTGGVGYAYMPNDGGFVVKRNLSDNSALFITRNSADDTILYANCEGGVGVNTSSIGDHSFKVYGDGTAATSAPVKINASYTGTTTYHIYFSRNAETDPEGYITSGVGGMQLQTSSDSSLKDDMKKTEKDALALLDQIEVKDFYWKKDKDKKNKETGYAADEAMGIIDGFTVDNEGVANIRPGVLIPYLHRAIQQLNERLTTLENA